MFIKKYFLLLLFLILNFLYQNNINFSLAKEIEIEYSKSKKEDFKIPYIKNEIDKKKGEFKAKISEGEEFNSKNNDDLAPITTLIFPLIIPFHIVSLLGLSSSLLPITDDFLE